MNAPFSPENQPRPLKVQTVEVMTCRNSIVLTFNHPPSDGEIEAYRKLPPTPQMFLDVRSYAERLRLAELVADLFKFYVLGSIVLPDTPLAMDWLKSYLNGDGHGPAGHPMRWPLCASAQNLLTRWGYVRTDDGFVAVAPKG